MALLPSFFDSWVFYADRFRGRWPSGRAKLLSYSKWAGVAMGQTSRIVTIVNGVQAVEVTTHDPEGEPIETYYRVRGEKYESLKDAMTAAG